MPYWLTEYEVHGTTIAGPLVVTETKDQAVAICDYLHAPDGLGGNLRIVGEALHAVPGPGPTSWPRVTCDCGGQVMVHLATRPHYKGTLLLPAIASHTPNGKRAPSYELWSMQAGKSFGDHEPYTAYLNWLKTSLCPRSGQVAIVSPALIESINRARRAGITS